MESMKLLALEASANTVSLAVQNARGRFTDEMPSSNKASAWLIPALLKLLEVAQINLNDLDAILFGQGPGAFTGLRTVCSVVQGLSLGLNESLPIYGVDTLHQLAQAGLNSATPKARLTSSMEDPLHFFCILDARMDEWYVATYEYKNLQWSCSQSPVICKPEVLNFPSSWSHLKFTLCSNIDAPQLQKHNEQLFQNPLLRFSHGFPNASLCLDLAQQLLLSSSAGGELLSPLRATPVYIRDRVALTTQERERAKLI